MLETFKGMLGTFKGKVENQREENCQSNKRSDLTMLILIFDSWPKP